MKKTSPGSLSWVVVAPSAGAGSRGQGAGSAEEGGPRRWRGEVAFDQKPRKLRRGGWAKERRQRLAWKRFLGWARLYARWRLSFVPWRGEEGGVPPEGFDAESVAMEAVMTVGRTQEEAGKPWRRDRKAVERAVRRLVDRLKHRREVWCTSSEPDLRWVIVDEGDESEEDVREAEQVADAGKRPDEELVEWERINEFKASLGPDLAAKELVDCYCGNVTSRTEIARLTGLTWREVKNARKRVRGKWKGFRRRAEGGGRMTEDGRQRNPKLEGGQC